MLEKKKPKRVKKRRKRETRTCREERRRSGKRVSTVECPAMSVRRLKWGQVVDTIMKIKEGFRESVNTNKKETAKERKLRKDKNMNASKKRMMKGS